MQRLRVTFSRGEEVKYISHLDMMRLWERALRRADMPVAYSQGFSPQPRLSLAAPLAVGVTSEGEIMDLFIGKRLSPYFFIKTMKSQLPKGIDISKVVDVSIALPSLQSQVRYGEYKVVMETDKDQSALEDALETFLNKDALPWTHLRDGQPRHYDLRSQVDDLWLVEHREGGCTLGMRLQVDSKGTGRPEQV
ncbi:MAG: TIGR03936 family radical SAM-associated protein, partial [Dehalococcoidia bacterium]|nr:TIGR03936 family radical SAM-associated protein [Dehalococcoidia bacterium]